MPELLRDISRFTTLGMIQRQLIDTEGRNVGQLSVL